MTSVLELRSVRGTGGGPEKTILLGAAHHDRDRFRVTVCYLRDERDSVFGVDRRAAELGVNYVEARERHSFDHRVWRRLREVADNCQADIVHGHDYKTNLLALLLARKTGAVAMATSHGWTGQSWRERALYYPGDRRVLRRLAHVLAVSSDVRNTLVQSGVRPEAVTVLLNGIDPDAFRPDPARRDRIRRELGLDPSTPLVGAVGRLEPQKRFDLLVDSVASLNRERPVRLAVVGDGSLRGPLEARVERVGLAGVCQFLGHRTDVAALHDAFDVFVQSSDYEGTPNAVLEAMAMETPVVATDVGGTTELARPDVHGLIVPPGDSTAIGRAIRQVLDDPSAARQRAVAARARIERDLSFAGRTRQLEHLYDRLTVGRQQGAAAGPVASMINRGA